jgi:hypothetical protein
MSAPSLDTVRDWQGRTMVDPAGGELQPRRRHQRPDISEEEHEVTFHEEIPAVEKRVVPRERVRLDTDTVTDQRQVAKEIRKEQVEVDEPGPAPPAGPALSRSRMGAGAAGPPAALSRQA